MKNIMLKLSLQAFCSLLLFIPLSQAQEIFPMTDEIPHEEGVNVSILEVSPNGKYIITADEAGILALRDTETGKLITTEEFGQSVSSVKFLDDNRHAIVIYENIQNQIGDISIEIMDFATTDWESIFEFTEVVSEMNYNYSPDLTHVVISYKLIENENKVGFLVRDLANRMDKQFFISTSKYFLEFNDNNTITVTYESLDDPNVFINDKIDVKSATLVSSSSTEKIDIVRKYDRKLISRIGDDLVFQDLSKNYTYSIPISDFPNEELSGEYLINQFDFSPDGKYLSIATGAESGFWSVGYGMNEDGKGTVHLYNVKDDHLMYRTSRKEKQFDVNVTNVKWINEGEFAAINYKGDIHIYSIYGAEYEKAFMKPDDIRNTTVAVNDDFSEIFYSVKGSHTAKYYSFDADPIEIQNYKFYEHVALANDGTTASTGCSAGKYGPSDATEEPTNSIYANNTQYFKPHNYHMEWSDVVVSKDGDFVVSTTSILGNYFVVPESKYVTKVYKDKNGNNIGYVAGGTKVYVEQYQKIKDLNVGDSIATELSSMMYITDLSHNGENYFLETQYRSDQTTISSDGNYLSMKSGYNYSDSNTEHCMIFNLREREWKTIDNKSILFNHFDPNSHMAYTVLEDKTTIIWETNTGNEFLKYPTNTEIPEVVSYNAKTGEFIIVLVGEISIYNTINGSWDYNQPQDVEDVLVAEFSPSGNFLKLEGIVETEEGEFYNMFFYRYPTMELIYSEKVKSTTFYTEQKNTNVFWHKTRDLCMLNNGLGSLILVDLEKEEALANIRLLPNGEWLVFTPSGLFDASKRGREILYYTVGQEVVLYDQIKEKYWEPGLLDKVLNSPEILVDDVVKEIPLYPQPTLTLKEETGIANVKLERRSGGIGRVSLFINDKEVVPNINPSNKLNFDIDITKYSDYMYKIGINEVAIEAYNSEGWLKSRRVSIYLETTLEGAKGNPFKKTTKKINDQSSTKPGLFGLFVGTSKYKNDAINLKFADKDAEILKDAFTKISDGMYDQERISLKILKSEGTEPEDKSLKTNIVRELNGIADQARPNDIIVLFLSGHGMTLDDDFYYLTADAGNVKIDEDISGRASVTLSSKEINEALRKIKSNKQVMILDACHSGQITKVFEGGGKAISTSQQKALENLEDKMGLYILASSEANQKSFEHTTLEQGILTFSLILGMSDGAVEDDIINVVDLLSFASKESENLSKKILSSGQRPVLGIGKGGSSFPIGLKNEELTINTPADKKLIGRPNFSQRPIGNDPLGLENALLAQLEDRGAFGNTELFTYTANKDEKNVSSITGSYMIVGDNIDIDWYLVNGSDIKGPFKLVSPKVDIINIADALINEATEKL
jgi:hypothetical protein